MASHDTRWTARRGPGRSQPGFLSMVLAVVEDLSLLRGRCVRRFSDCIYRLRGACWAESGVRCTEGTPLIFHLMVCFETECPQVAEAGL